jgi:hypothetical protein
MVLVSPGILRKKNKKEEGRRLKRAEEEDIESLLR